MFQNLKKNIDFFSESDGGFRGRLRAIRWRLERSRTTDESGSECGEKNNRLNRKKSTEPKQARRISDRRLFATDFISAKLCNYWCN